MKATPATLRILIVKHLGWSVLRESVTPSDDLRIVRVNTDGTRDDLGALHVVEESDEREPWRGEL